MQNKFGTFINFLNFIIIFYLNIKYVNYFNSKLIIILFQST